MQILYSNCYTYGLIARELNRLLKDGRISAVFSTGKEELVLQIVTKDQRDFQWVFKFVEGELYFRFFMPQLNFGRRCLHQFKHLPECTIAGVVSVPHERILILNTHSGFQLLVAGFGRFANVMLFNPEGGFEESFKYSANPPVDIRDLLPPVVHVAGQLQTGSLPFLSAEQKTYLRQQNFDQAQPEDREIIFREFELKMNESQWYQNPDTDPPSLNCFPSANAELLEPGLAGIDRYAARFISRSLFLREKNRRRIQLERQIQHCEKLLGEQQQRIHTILNRRSYKELGDIILSYAHSIKPGVSSAFVPDYYTGQQIRIKLDPDLNASRNAEKYYRKARNEGIELQTLELNMEQTRIRLSSLQEELGKTLEAPDIRHLKTTESKIIEKAPAKAYKEYDYMGYQIWVGKNARSNDELLRLAGKNDMWLHARDTSGSHVIIKKSGNRFPDSVIEFAAILAAKNSRAKSQSVVPVIAVERKFVSKPKHAAPGEVKVLRERIIDAYLNEN